jgi:hypothetical protein
MVCPESGPLHRFTADCVNRSEHEGGRPGGGQGGAGGPGPRAKGRGEPLDIDVLEGLLSLAVGLLSRR